MFVLVAINDTIRIDPIYFDRPQLQAITEELERKYSNKVVDGTGLGVCVYDFKSVGDPFIYPSDGGSHIKGYYT